jgi:putative addiction module antidote
LKQNVDDVITFVDTSKGSNMTIELKVRRVGNSLGLVLPKEALNQLNVGDGDQLYITEAPGGYRLTAADPEFAKQMEVAEKGMRRYRNALRELAK